MNEAASPRRPGGRSQQGKKKIIFSHLRTSFRGWVLDICRNLPKHLSKLLKLVFHLYLKSFIPYRNPVLTFLAPCSDSVSSILTLSKNFLCVSCLR